MASEIDQAFENMYDFLIEVKPDAIIEQSDKSLSPIGKLSLAVRYDGAEILECIEHEVDKNRVSQLADILRVVANRLEDSWADMIEFDLNDYKDVQG